MSPAITQDIDIPQLMVAIFILFFIGLVYYLRREDRREGYPLVDDERLGMAPDSLAPPAKVFLLLEGGTTQMPHRELPSRMLGRAVDRHPGAPLVPLGDPLEAEIGPGAYPMRKDVPLMAHGSPQVVPLRVSRDWSVMAGDIDPRGFTVFDLRHDAVGTVRELWVDRSVKILRYLEVSLAPSLGQAVGDSVLVPIYYAAISRRRLVRVRALLAPHFARIPRTAQPDRISAREEDRLNAFFSGAQFYGLGREGGLPAAYGARP
jgi:photosynthetic reaction center H subunit